MLSVLLRFIDSDNPFGIFKLFFGGPITMCFIPCTDLKPCLVLGKTYFFSVQLRLQQNKNKLHGIQSITVKVPCSHLLVPIVKNIRTLCFIGVTDGY